MIKTINLSFLFFLSFFFISCGSKEASLKEKQAIIEVIEKNQEALYRMDSAKLGETSFGMVRIWEQKAALSALGTMGDPVSIKEILITDFDDEKAIVKVTLLQKSTEHNGGSYVYDSIRTVRKIKGQWLLSDIEDLDGDYLEE